jgi:hypothetical protein
MEFILLQFQKRATKKLSRRLLFQNKNITFFSRSLFLTAAVLLSSFSCAQQIANYVSNGGFEQLSSYSVMTQDNAANFWQPIDTNKFSYVCVTTLPPISNAPYFYGYQFARKGNTFALSTFFCSNCGSPANGYPRNRLKQALQSGKTYCVKFYVVNTNNSPLGIDKIGAYFGGTSIDTITKCNNPIPYISPQVVNANGIITDTMNWVPITGTFVANGSEKYMVLGNFNSITNTNTLLINPTYSATLANDICIDDVSCIDVDLPAYAGPGPDTWCIPGDSVFIGRQPDVGIDEACTWYKVPNMSVPIATIAGLWVKPTVTTTYIVKQEICAGIKYDTIVVHQSAVGLEKYNKNTWQVNLFPSPANNFVTLFSSLPEGDVHVEIFDAGGKSVYANSVRIANNQSKLQLDLQNGIYFVSISNTGNEKIVKKLIISK